MKADCYITFNARGVTGAVKRAPQLDVGEFAVRLRLTIPDAMFKPETPVVDLTIPERAVIVPVVEIITPASVDVPASPRA